MTKHPAPRTEEPQLEPGGADSIEDPKYGEAEGPPITPDLPPHLNPATDDLVPEEIAAKDDKTQDPDRTSGEGPVPEEPPA